MECGAPAPLLDNALDPQNICHTDALFADPKSGTGAPHSKTLARSPYDMGVPQIIGVQCLTRVGDPPHATHFAAIFEKY